MTQPADQFVESANDLARVGVAGEGDRSVANDAERNGERLSRRRLEQRDPGSQPATGVVHLGLRQVERILALDVATAHVIADSESHQPQSRREHQGELRLGNVPSSVRANLHRFAGPTTRCGVALKNSSGRLMAAYTRSYSDAAVSDSSIRAVLLRR